MAIRYLLDANVLSEPVRPRPAQTVVESLEASFDEAATSALVLHELEFGIARLAPSRKRALLERYVADVVRRIPVLPYDATVARWHAHERSRLTKRGRSPAFVDGQIAATAVVHGLVLVTRNVGDFQHFAELKVENWFGRS